MYSEVSNLDLSDKRNKRGKPLGDPCAGNVPESGSVIREPEVGMTQTYRVGIAGLEDEVSSHVCLVRYYARDWIHRTSWNRTSYGSWGLAITISEQTKGAPKEHGAR